MHTLAVLQLSDSFEALWPALAGECGLAFAACRSAAELPRGGGVVTLVAAGGAEELLDEALAHTDGSAAAVGALAEHRLAVRLVRAGAAEYFALPGDVAALRAWVADQVARARAATRQPAFADAEQARYRFDGILGASTALREALARVGRVIPHRNVTVLLLGETGTGKELFARAIHHNGPRRGGPFVDVNCAAIPDHLLESELFGHEKGAFTDAGAAKPGLFEAAHGGTIFLDEVGHLPLPLQGKLLRVLQERTTRRVGGVRTLAVDVRVVAATHADLAGAVRRGQFREDLYFRLNVVPVVLPPLRARRDDVLPLARHFLARFAEEYGLPVPTLSPGAERALLQRPWPGNVRELRNAMERALLLASGPTLEASELAPDLAPAVANGHAEVLPFPAPIDTIVRAATAAMVRSCGGNRSEAARRLGISRSRLARWLDGGDFGGDDGGRD